MTVTVADVVKNLEEQLQYLKSINQDLPVEGLMDDGGYVDGSLPLKEFSLNVESDPEYGCMISVRLIEDEDSF